MTTREYELLLAIGSRLAQAQAAEQKAAAAHRSDPTAVSRENWLHALQTVESLTDAYVDSSLQFVRQGEQVTRQASPQEVRNLLQTLRPGLA